jgi:uncharacterized protein (DUF362 family)
MSKSRVVIRSTVNRPVDEVVAEVMRACEWERAVPEGALVVVKPNLCTPSPELVEVANTSPEVLSAVCAVLKTRTQRVVIAESDGIRYSAEEAFRMNGTYDIGARFGFEVKSLSRDELVDVGHPHLRGWPLPKTLLECDVLITVAKIKTHATTTFTGALKNQWGCVPQHDRLLIHKHLHTLIGDVNKLLKTRLGILDGLVGMEGRGPINGSPVRLNVIAGSLDVVALDAAAMRFVGLDPMESRHLRHAAQIGVGQIAPDQIEVDADTTAVRPFLPAETDWPIRMLNVISHSRFLTKHLLMNDTVFMPARRFANFCRRIKGQVLGGAPGAQGAGR